MLPSGSVSESGSIFFFPFHASIQSAALLRDVPGASRAVDEPASAGESDGVGQDPAGLGGAKRDRPPIGGGYGRGAADEDQSFGPLVPSLFLRPPAGPPPAATFALAP